jgi:hypothetical protein
MKGERCELAARVTPALFRVRNEHYCTIGNTVGNTTGIALLAILMGALLAVYYLLSK